MPEAPHPFDGIAQSLYDWMEEQANWAADALRGGYRAPFSADVSERDKLDYYRRQMFVAKPDGSVDYTQPNADGRKVLLDRLGTAGYAQVYEAVKPAQGRRPPVEPTPDAPSDQPAIQPLGPPPGQPVDASLGAPPSPAPDQPATPPAPSLDHPPGVGG